MTQMTREISMQELDDQRVEMLPRRETLGSFSNGGDAIQKFHFNAMNTALALSIASKHSTVAAAAVQTITIS